MSLLINEYTQQMVIAARGGRRLWEARGADLAEEAIRRKPEILEVATLAKAPRPLR